MDEGDRGQHERVGSAEELGEPLFDLDVGTGAPQQAGPAGVRAPPLDRRRYRGDDLRVEVETEVVARSEIGQPVVADPDAPSLYLVYYGVHHRVG